VINWGAGGGGAFVNFRFAQPGRGPSQRVSRWYPVRQFPFANQTLVDPVTGQTAGRLERCTATGTCPRIFEINSSNDYWTKVASALTTDTVGDDLKDASGARSYLIASLPHMAASGLASCTYPRNPLGPGAILRAMLIALDEWATSGKRPPEATSPVSPTEPRSRQRHKPTRASRIFRAFYTTVS
jgi:hypothetical protein